MGWIVGAGLALLGAAVYFGILHDYGDDYERDLIIHRGREVCLTCGDRYCRKPRHVHQVMP